MSLRWMLPLVVAVAVAGCSSPRNVEGGGTQTDPALARCTGCHGNPANGNAAPPLAVTGSTDPAYVGVGAHQQHVQGIDGAGRPSGIRLPLACSECHVVPVNVDDPGHIDQATATLTWGPLATAGGVTPTYQRSADGTTATCTNYCHGAAFAAGNGTVHAPVWTKVDGSQGSCGTCHGIPPPAPHPAAPSLTACAQCHPQTMNADGTINVASGRHINGTIDLVGGTGGCTACHGDPNRTQTDIAAAPPRDTKGNAATTAPGVGAHQTHLVGSSVRGSLACSACHVVPTDLNHVTAPLDLTWGALARTGGFTPTWNATTVTCTNYCHGLPAWGGSNSSPVWTKVDGSQMACGTCHAIPPPSPHPAVSGGATVCAGCHPGTVKADGTIDVAGGKHIDGTVEVSGTSCTACHGDATRTNQAIAAAPPRDVSGNTATTSPGVGAHQAHLTGADLVATPVGCSDCHNVPTTLAHASQPLDLTWGPLARKENVQPAFDPTALTCTNYCHGATLSGGSNATPKWTGGANEATCGSCHGVPPPSGRHAIAAHAPYANSCATCHGAGYAPTFVNKATHIDGTRNVMVSAPITTWDPAAHTCTALCHANQTQVRSWY